MPPSKPKPAEIAAEAKRSYIPYIREKLTKWPAHSYLIADSSVMQCSPRPETTRLRIGVIEGDPVDVALDFHEDVGDIMPVINMANDKRPGGDWDQSATMAFEECFCRRSNLASTLATPAPNGHATVHYPIPQKGGIYSPHVVVFRSGPDRYQVWQEFKSLPVISVSPVRRPKLTNSSTPTYSFPIERELMKEKIRTALRIAVYYQYSDICLGAFGCGPGFRNPAHEVATLWKEVLYGETEFRGHFTNVVFAIENYDEKKSTSSSSKGKGKTSTSKSGKSDLEIFKEVFDPAKLFGANYRSPAISSYRPDPAGATQWNYCHGTTV